MPRVFEGVQYWGAEEMCGVMKLKNPIFAKGKKYEACSPRILAHLRLHSGSFCIGHMYRLVPNAADN